MAQDHAVARSSTREELPIDSRVYGLENIVSAQDAAIAQQAITLAKHDERLAAHDTLLAVQDNTQASMQKAMDAVVTELVKTRWTLIAFAISGIGIAFGLH